MPEIARSIIVYRIKPYDVETDLEELAKKIKKVKLNTEFWKSRLSECEDERCTLEEGCKWSESHKLKDIGYGIKALIIQCVVQDELVGSDDLIETVTDLFEDEIQSVDIASFNKM